MKPLKNKQLSLLLPILGFTAASASAVTLIDFEGYALGSNLSANGWNLTGSDSSTIIVVETANSGSYVGGKAIQTDAGGSGSFGLLVTQPGITGLQVDMNWDFYGTPGTTTTPTLQLSGWDDVGADGVFASGERQIGFAMDNDGDFEFMSGGTEVDGDTSTVFSAQTWYRLSLSWTEPDGAGNRDVTLSGYDLTNDTDLGVVNTVTMTSTEFGTDPSEWDGVGIRMTRGTMDNIEIQAVPEPGSALLGLFGGALLLLRRRKN